MSPFLSPVVLLAKHRVEVSLRKGARSTLQFQKGEMDKAVKKGKNLLITVSSKVWRCSYVHYVEFRACRHIHT